MRAAAATAASIAACILAAAPASAQLMAESDDPIDITGDSLEVIDDVATWTGEVRAVQGDAILTADRLIATLDEEGGFRTIRAVGAVRYANPNEAITSETAVYDSIERAITMTENVVVTQGKTVMTGGALVYWLDSGRIHFTAPGGRRIRGIFHTKSLDAPS